MIILIAESKTMEKREHPVSADEFAAHCPRGEEGASDIMRRIDGMALPDIVAATKTSAKMAVEIKKLAYEFPNKSVGLTAIDAFTGVVFDNLDWTTLDPDDKEWADSRLRIISSLYGWLKPSDIIKPYRMDYNSKLGPDASPLYAFWRKDVTLQLVKTVQESGDTVILDLMPGDAAKCIDWKLVKRFAKVWKVDFKEHEGDTLKTPNAGRLKALRGELLRHIILGRLLTPQQVAAFESDSMMPAPPPYPNYLSFYV